jgi:hypothetical protein
MQIAIRSSPLLSPGQANRRTIYDSALQDFVNVVSAFSVRTGVVVGMLPMHTQEGSEIETVVQLLDMLNLSGVCLSLDALHTQKNC